MFEVKTRRSFKKALALSQRHHNALYGQSADSFVAGVFSSFAPLSDEFLLQHNKWSIALGEKEAAVQDLNETLLLMNRRIKEWEGKIFFHYPEGTEQAKTIFPNKRTPFYRGKYVMRVEAVAILAKQLADYLLLSAAKTEVENFHVLLSGKLEKRLMMEGAVKKQKDDLETLRKEITSAMRGNLGLLMHHYRTRPRMLKVFFDIGVIKNKVRRKKRAKKKSISL